MPFMQRALAGGVIAALLAGYYGAFVVQRGLSFLGNGLAHAAFGGVALGLLLRIEPLWIAAPFTAGVAAAIIWVQDRAKLRGDTAIGVLFAVSMALGVIFLSFRREFTADAFSYLFGSILAITPADLYAAVGVAILTGALWPFWGRWAYATFDRELARADRVAATRDDYVLSIALAVTIVVAIKLVGILLIAAFLVIPAAAARLFARTFFMMSLYSIAIGVASAVAGLWISYSADLPTGPAIVLVQAAIFFASLLKRR